MDEAIEDGVSEGAVTDDGVPVLGFELGSDDGVVSHALSPRVSRIDPPPADGSFPESRLRWSFLKCSRTQMPP